MVGWFSQPLKGMCTSTEEIITAVFELDGNYGGEVPKILTLSDELKNRGKNTSITQEQMIELIRNAVDALICLEKAGIVL